MEKNVDVRNKGKSLFLIPENYTVVDLETTGFSAKFNHIIEIGCVKVRGGKKIEHFQTLVKPPEPIPYIIECMTGIHNEMVVNAPIFQDVAKKLWDFLENEIIVGHNVHFDINFLYDNFKRSLGFDFSNDFVDTLRLARQIIPDISSKGYPGYGLDYLFHYLENIFYPKKIFKNESPQFNRHRALTDCNITDFVLECLNQLVIDNNIDLSKILAVRKNLANITSDHSNFDESNIFFDKYCVFTGKLEKFTRVEAAQIVVNAGGHCENNITKNTNFLIVGDMDYKKGLEGYESNKLKKAKKLIASHQDLQIIPESAFYDLVTD